MADNLMNGIVVDLDLNQEPMESSSNTGLGLGSFWNDLETANTRIEQRILHLEAVASRWRQACNSSGTQRDAAIIQLEHQTLDSITETSSSASVPSSSQSNEVSDAAVQLENLTTDSGNVPVSRSSFSSRRRISFLRLSDVDSELLRETSRRRLN